MAALRLAFEAGLVGGWGEVRFAPTCWDEGTGDRATLDDMEEAGSMKTVTVIEPDFEGSYRVLERRPDGTLVLQPEREQLSRVVAETDGQVFRDEEFITHLERLEAAEDDLPPDERE